MPLKKKTGATAIEAKLSNPAKRAMAGAGIHTLQQLSKWTEKGFLALHGVGPTAVVELRRVLKENGLSFSEK